MIVFKMFIKNLFYNKKFFIGYLFILLSVSLLNLGDDSKSLENFKEISLSISVVDNSNTALSNSLIKFLKINNEVTYIQKDLQKIKEDVYLSKYDAAIIIPENFDELVLNKKNALTFVSSNNTMNSYMLLEKLKMFFSTSSVVNENGKYDISLLESSLKIDSKVEMLKDTNFSEDSYIIRFYNFSSFIIISLLVTVIGSIMVDFGKKELENRVRVSKTSISSYNSQIFIGQIVTAVILVSIITLIFYIIKLYMGKEGNLILYTVNTLFFSMSIIGMINLIYNIKATRNVVYISSNILSLGLSFISGVIVPIQYIDKNVLMISKIFPVYYFVKANEEVYNTNIFQWKYIGVMLLFTITYFLIGLLISKIKSDEIN